MTKPKYEVDMAQDENEMREFIELLQREQITSYLEIGARYGASLWRIAMSMPKGSRIVAVDLPTGWGGRPDGQVVLEACFVELRARGYEAHMILGDSLLVTTVDEVRKFAPFDCVYIDGHHSLAAVKADWANYGSMGRIVAFHDIAWRRPEKWKPHRKRLEVPLVWDKLKEQHRHHEIKHHPTGEDNGIGVLWRE